MPAASPSSPPPVPPAGFASWAAAAWTPAPPVPPEAVQPAEDDMTPTESDKARGAEGLKLAKIRSKAEGDDVIPVARGEMNEEDVRPEQIAHQVYEFQLDEAWFMGKSAHKLSKEAFVKSAQAKTLLKEKIWPMALEEATKQAVRNRKRDERKARVAQEKIDLEKRLAEEEEERRLKREQREKERQEAQAARVAQEGKEQSLPRHFESTESKPPPEPEKPKITPEEQAQLDREMLEYEWAVARRRAREAGQPEPPMPLALMSPAQLEEYHQEEAEKKRKAEEALRPPPPPAVLIIQPPAAQRQAAPANESGCCSIQ